MTRNVVTIEGLRHSYGRTLALDGVDLTVAPGECVALPGVITVSVDAGRVRLTSTAAEAAVRQLLDADPHLTDLRVEAASLEEAVVSFTSDTAASALPTADTTHEVSA